MRSKVDAKAAVDDRVYSERVALIRWPRIWFSLTMILVAIIWIAIDNRLGIVDRTLAPTPTVFARKAVPALATPQVVAGIEVNAKLISRMRTLEGTSSPPGFIYLIMAIQVINESPKAFPLSPDDFRVGANGGAPVQGRPYQGQASQLLTPHLAAGMRAEGLLTFLAPTNHTSALLQYIPAVHPAQKGVYWRLQ